MQTTPALIRQALGCGYLPPAPEGVAVRIWDHPARDPDRTTRATVCPGFSVSLPEVLSTSYARLHWKQNQLQAWCRGQPTEQQIQAIEILEVSANAADQHAIENPIKRGT